MPTPARKKQFSYLQPGYRAGNGSLAQYLRPKQNSNDGGFGKYLNKSEDRSRTRFRTL